jgi:hypothetical protein
MSTSTFPFVCGWYGRDDAAADAVARADRAPSARAVGAGVVGQDALDSDPLLAVPGERAGRGRWRRPPRPLWQKFAVGRPRMVVDRQVQVPPIGAAVAADAVAEDALADRPEAAELSSCRCAAARSGASACSGNGAADGSSQA